MRRTVFCFAAASLALALIAVSSGAPGKASAVERFNSSFGPGVDAQWFTESPGGINTFVFVNAGEFRSGRTTQSIAFVDIHQFSPGDPSDPNDDTFREIHGPVELSEGDFVISGRSLDGASLKVSIPAEDCTFTGPPPPGEESPPPDCVETTIDVDLTWIAIGPITREHGSFHFQSPECSFHSSFFGRQRPASVSGSVSAGSSDFTEGLTSFARIIARSHSTDIQIGDCFPSEVPA